MSIRPALLCLAIIAQPAFAQPTLTAMEDYTVGHKIETVICDTGTLGLLNVSPGPGGANQVWDFSSLSGRDSFTSYIIPATGNAFSSQFPGANIGRRNVYANGDVEYGFYNKTSTSTDLLGFIDSTGTHGSPKYPDSVLTAVRPFTYSTVAADTYTINFDWVFKSPNTPPYVHQTGYGNDTIVADGYGTLILPNRTYHNVMRIKNTHLEWDAPAPPFNTSAWYTSRRWRTMYKWYSDSFASPLLTIDSDAFIINLTSPLPAKYVSYTKSEVLLSTPTPTALAGISNANSFSAAIKSDRLCVMGLPGGGAPYEVSLFNINGQQVYTSTFRSDHERQYFDMNAEPVPGIYFLSVRESRNAAVPQIIKLLKE